MIEQTILFDIDGTLVINKQYPENFEKIKLLISKLKKEGFKFGICTGRAFDESVKKIYRDFGFNGEIITECGARVSKKKVFGFKDVLINENQVVNLNKILNREIVNYLKSKGFKVKVFVSSDKSKQAKSVVINKKRQQTSTVYFPKTIEYEVQPIIEILKKDSVLKNMNFVQASDKLKVYIYPKNINKFIAIENVFRRKEVILVTDFEESLQSKKEFIKIYSIGTNLEFNKFCDKVYPAFGKGIEKILKNIKEKNYDRL